MNAVFGLRYIDGKGSPGAVNVNLSRFASVEGAYGFFTKRVVADADPAETVPAALDAGGAGALGSAALLGRGALPGQRRRRAGPLAGPVARPAARPDTDRRTPPWPSAR